MKKILSAIAIAFILMPTVNATEIAKPMPIISKAPKMEWCTWCGWFPGLPRNY